MQGRHEILDWAEEGRIAPGELRRALDVAGALPDALEWRSFLDRLLLFGGTVLVAAGVIFFLAFNWNDLGRMFKFALVEALIVAALAFVWRLGLERISGKAALLGAALLTGALLALIGQTYQTGADTFELFAVWALAILPWALVARFPALWLFWLLLVNLAAFLYVGTTRRALWFFAGSDQQLWLLFALNTVALIVWEGLALSGEWRAAPGQWRTIDGQDLMSLFSRSTPAAPPESEAAPGGDHRLMHPRLAGDAIEVSDGVVELLDFFLPGATPQSAAASETGGYHSGDALPPEGASPSASSAARQAAGEQPRVWPRIWVFRCVG